MAYSNIVLEKLGNGNRIGRITLNRPEKVNALSEALLQELEQCLVEAERDKEVRVVIIRGSGRGFSAGYDLGHMTEAPSFAELRQMVHDGARRQLLLWNLGKPTIAQVHGFCLAGGCEYAMMADLVIAADDALIGHPGTRGLGTPRNSCIWPMVLGMRKAKELMLTGDTIDGREAERIGMINKSVPADQLEREVLRVAERIANQTADALAIHKHAVNRWYEHMGILPAVRSASDYDVMYAYTEQAKLWWDAVKEKGLKGAFAWRDGLYGDLTGARGPTAQPK